MIVEWLANVVVHFSSIEQKKAIFSFDLDWCFNSQMYTLVNKAYEHAVHPIDQHNDFYDEWVSILHRVWMDYIWMAMEDLSIDQIESFAMKLTLIINIQLFVDKFSISFT